VKTIASSKTKAKRNNSPERHGKPTGERRFSSKGSLREGDSMP
jgi:hypothetical protein